MTDVFNTDDHHLIGSMHVSAGKPCQDYALSGRCKNVAWATVSDGCSTGGLTDIGARLLSLATSSAICKIAEANLPLLACDIADEQKIIMHQLKQTLPIQTTDLLATSLYVCLTEKGGYVSVRGDGAVAFKWIDGSITLHQFNWPNNTPFYPAYGLEGTKPFVDAHGGDLGARIFEEQVWSYHPDTGAFALRETKLHSVLDGIRGTVLPITYVEALDIVAVFTDGVSLVEHVDSKDVVKELLAFKSLEGAFAKRRMIRYIQDTRKIGKGPIDDIAYAVIRVSHERR